MNTKHTNGLLADIATQCVSPDTGETGSWLFTAGNHREKGTAVSPVFPDLVELFRWARGNGWSQIGHGLGARYIYRNPQP